MQKLSRAEDGVLTKYRLNEETGFTESRYDGDKWAVYLLNL